MNIALSMVDNIHMYIESNSAYFWDTKNYGKLVPLEVEPTDADLAPGAGSVAATQGPCENPTKSDGVHPHGDQFQVVMAEGDQHFTKEFATKTEAQTWYDAAVLLRKEKGLEPFLKHLNSAVEENAKTLQACKAMAGNDSLQVRLPEISLIHRNSHSSGF